VTQEPHPHSDKHEFRAEALSLWRTTFAPATWALHFVLCYALVSLSCIHGTPPVAITRSALILATLAALAVIALLGWRSYRHWAPGRTGRLTHPYGTPEHRHHFLGHAAFLLAIISAIGVVFVALPLLVIGGCQ